MIFQASIVQNKHLQVVFSCVCICWMVGVMSTEYFPAIQPDYLLGSLAALLLVVESIKKNSSG